VGEKSYIKEISVFSPASNACTRYMIIADMPLAGRQKASWLMVVIMVFFSKYTY